MKKTSQFPHYLQTWLIGSQSHDSHKNFQTMLTKNIHCFCFNPTYLWGIRKSSTPCPWKSPCSSCGTASTCRWRTGRPERRWRRTCRRWLWPCSTSTPCWSRLGPPVWRIAEGRSASALHRRRMPRRSRWILPKKESSTVKPQLAV